jgi:hypothetical protein
MRISILALTLSLSFAAAAVGQAVAPAAGYSPGRPLLYDPGYYFLPRHSSTLEEGIQRGYGDVVRSYGMANLLNSEAAKNYEQARRDYLDNRLRATQTYFEMRRYNDDYRAAQRGQPLSFEQYVRLAKQQAPDRLSVSQLDPFTGTIQWPLALQRPEYAEYRERIERLFQLRAHGTALVFDEIAEAIELFTAQLQTDLDSFKQPEYIQAKNFLLSLDYEAQLLQQG